MAKKLTKYQAKDSQVKATADSTEYFKGKKELYGKMAGLQRQFYGMTDETKASMETARQAAKDEVRQWKKGKFGLYDKDGHPINLTSKSNKSQPDSSKSDWYKAATKLMNKKAGGTISKPVTSLDKVQEYYKKKNNG